VARRYARDNRGRFASSGSGATARGGRLKTASGNKRATQTMRAAGAGGVIKGRAARTVAGEKAMAKLAKRAPAAKRINAARPGGTVAKPKGLKPGAIKARAKGAVPKVDLTLKGIADRRKRANAPRKSMYLSQKMETNSAITRSAANAIYNRQRRTGKALGVDREVLRNPAGIMPGVYGSKKQRASQIREAARKRVVGGRRR
jgi:hypothetical protein